jgi:hypothetical protein
MNVLDINLRNDSQPNLAVDTPKREVIDFIPKRRYVFPLGGIDVQRKHISGRRQVLSEFETEGSIATAILSKTLAVAPDSGSQHHAFKVDKDPLVIRTRRQVERTPIRGDELIIAVIEAVPWQDNIRVRDCDASKPGIIEARLVYVGGGLVGVAPASVKRKYNAACSNRMRWRGEGVCRNLKGRRESSGRLQERSTIHKTPR